MLMECKEAILADFPQKVKKGTTGLPQFSGFLIRGLADSEEGNRLIKKLLEINIIITVNKDF